jgi:hypothetical protein
LHITEGFGTSEALFLSYIIDDQVKAGGGSYGKMEGSAHAGKEAASPVQGAFKDSEGDRWGWVSCILDDGLTDWDG